MNGPTDWDDAYANGAHIAGAGDYPPRWAAAAEAFRNALGERARLALPYGPHPRERFDLFLPPGAPVGLAVYVHGGYWLRFAPADWSHFAAGGVAAGWAVAMPGYTLCPAVRIADITRQIAAAIEAAAAMVDGPIALTGHSAGGHLVTRMVCADGPLTPSVRDRISGVTSVSGVHDLRPLLRTAMNRSLRLDEAEARAESPVLLRPVDGIRLTCWVGADERPEFVRQSDLLANVWTGLGARTRSVIDPMRHHFDVIDGLLSPDSALTRAWLSTET